MARYRFALNGGTYGEPRRFLATLRKVREVAHRDGPDYAFKAQDKHFTRQYHTAIRFIPRAALGLQHAAMGDLCKVATKNGGPTLLGRVYLIRKVPKPTQQDTPGERAITAAMGELGTVYRFGIANGPEDPGEDAFDCSGLTQWAWQQATGITLPHNANAQKDSTLVSLFFDKARCARGDLVFMWFPNSRGIIRPNASHVGLFYAQPSRKTGALMLYTRNPIGEPVAIRPHEEANVEGYGRLRATRVIPMANRERIASRPKKCWSASTARWTNS
jgi:cell wall-associated NlpC family hydrolase